MFSLMRGKKGTGRLFMAILTVSLVATIWVLIIDAAIGDDGDEIDIFLPGGQGSNSGQNGGLGLSFSVAPFIWGGTGSQVQYMTVSMVLNSPANLYTVPLCEELSGIQYIPKDSSVKIAVNSAGSGHLPKNPHSLLEIRALQAGVLEVHSDDSSLLIKGYYGFDTQLKDLFQGLAQLTMNGGSSAVSGRLFLAVNGIDDYDATTMHKAISDNAGEMRMFFPTAGRYDLTGLINLGKSEILNGDANRLGVVHIAHDAQGTVVSITNAIIDVDESNLVLGDECPVFVETYTFN